MGASIAEVVFGAKVGAPPADFKGGATPEFWRACGWRGGRRRGQRRARLRPCSGPMPCELSSPCAYCTARAWQPDQSLSGLCAIWLAFVCDQAIADPRLGDEMPWSHRIGFQLVAQLLHVDAQV